MIAEDFGPVYTRGHPRSATPTQSAIVIDIAVKLVKPKSVFDADKRPGEYRRAA